MKKNFKLLSAVFLALAIAAPGRSETLSVFNNTTGTSYVIPIHSTYYDTPGTRSQVIYPASVLEVMSGQQINGITFYANDGIQMNGGQFSLSIGETGNESFEVPIAYVEGLTQVATASMVKGETELTVMFSTPYTYNGGNLVVDMTVVEGGDWGTTHFVGVTQAEWTGLTRSNQRQMFIPKATFDYGIPEDYSARISSQELNFTTTVGSEAVQTLVVTNNGLNAFTAVVGNLESPFGIEAGTTQLEPGATLTIPVKFAPDASGEYTATLAIDCGQAGGFEIALAGKAVEPSSELIVADGTDESYYLPVYGGLYDMVGGRDQMIYPAQMLSEMQDAEVVAVTFYPTQAITFGGGNIQLSLKVIDEEGFEKAAPFTGLTAVANLAPERYEATELTFVFDTPFKYTGGNLLIETLVTEAGSFGNTEFYGINQDYSPSYYYYNWYAEDYAVDSFLPKAGFMYRSSQSSWMTGDVNHDRIVDVEDVTLLINYVLTGEAQDGFYVGQAECTGNSPVDVEDVTALISYVLTGTW